MIRTTRPAAWSRGMNHHESVRSVCPKRWASPAPRWAPGVVPVLGTPAGAATGAGTAAVLLLHFRTWVTGKRPPDAVPGVGQECARSLAPRPGERQSGHARRPELEFTHSRQVPPNVAAARRRCGERGL